MTTATELSDGVAFTEGEYRPVAEAKISFFDQAVMTSDATYDVVHVWNGSFFRLEDHLERFEQSCNKMRLKPPYDRAGVAEILTECVRRSGLRNAFVEMACTRGVATPGTRDLDAFTNQLVAFAVPYIDLATPEQKERGLHVFVSSVERTSPKSVDPTIKNYSRLDFILAELETKERGADRALLLDADGYVTEGHGYNIFALCGGTLMTPVAGVLEGITRRTVLELCAETNVEAQTGLFTADQLRGADEVLITSTAGGIMPVTMVDGRPVGDGHPGPLTLRLQDLYWAKHDDPEYATPIEYAA